MSALITVHRQRAFLRQGEWSCADITIERQLNEVTKSWIQETGGPSPWDSNPDRTVAKAVSRIVGGRLLMSIPARNGASGEIYFKRRQLELDFQKQA